MDTLPNGTLTFLLTDIEGSTRLLEQLGPAWGEALDAHHDLMRAAVAAAGGELVNTNGDAVFAAFTRSQDAIAAAVDAQRALASASWPGGVALRVRMGLHSGAAERAGQDYAGLAVHVAARISAAAHGGQVLVSSAALALAGDALPAGVAVRAMGEHHLKDISQPQRLHQLCIDGLPSDFPPPRTLDAGRGALPAQATPFIGRTRETAEVRALLADARILTLTGPGGTGKSRLALNVAAEAAGDFRDRVVFASLAPLEDPDLVASTIAAAIGVQEEAGRPILASLIDRVAAMEVLLVIDNFEHVVDAAPLVGDLVGAGPAVRVLVTSRAPLRVAGEVEYRVRPLGLPDPHDATPDSLAESEAVALFVARAQAIDPAFALTPDNAAAVAGICAAVDGLPLAIELAAARIRLLSPEAILERLGTCLALLAGGPRDRPERQRTLRGTVTWSHDLLQADAQAMFRRLAVFAGGWSLEAAEAICTGDGSNAIDPLTALDELVQHSLVQRDETAARRFGMLQTFREFAAERLTESGEEPAVRERHARHFAGIAAQAAGELTGPAQSGWLDRLEREQDNLRAALRWSIAAQEPVTGLTIAAAIWRFWQLRDHLAEGEGWLTELLAAPAQPSGAPARAAGVEALANVVYWRGDYAAARDRYEQAMEMYSSLGDDTAAAGVRMSLGWVAAAVGDWALAQERFGEAADAARARDDARVLGYALQGLGMSALRGGDPVLARAALAEAIGLLEDSGETFGLANALYDHGRALVMDGDHARGRAELLEAIRLHRAAGDMTGVAFGLDALSSLAVERDEPERAVRFAAAADALRTSLVARAPTAIVGVWDVRAAVGDALSSDAIDAAWAEGGTMELDRVLNDAEGGDDV